MKSENLKSINKSGYTVFPVTDKLRKYLKQIIFQKLTDLLNLNKTSENQLIKTLYNIDDRLYKSIFIKKHRLFNKEEAEIIKEEINIKKLFPKAERVDISFINSQNIDNKNLFIDSYDIYWRCVRKNKLSDVGNPHIDQHFWELEKGTDKEPFTSFNYDERWKIWIPIFGCDNENSIQFIPGSHNDDIKVALTKTEFGIKPNIEKNYLDKNESKFISPIFDNKNYVLFHDKLVHRGPKNRTEKLRISAEFTILVKN